MPESAPGMRKDSGMQSDRDLFCRRLQNVAAHAGVSCADLDCVYTLREYGKHMRLGDAIMGIHGRRPGAMVRHEFHEDMLSQIHATPHRAAALKGLCALMDAEFDCIVEHVVEFWFRVRSYTRRRIQKEQQCIKWVNPAFLQSEFFPSHEQHGPRRPQESKRIERMYYLWRITGDHIRPKAGLSRPSFPRKCWIKQAHLPHAGNRWADFLPKMGSLSKACLDPHSNSSP